MIFSILCEVVLLLIIVGQYYDYYIDVTDALFKRFVVFAGCIIRLNYLLKVCRYTEARTPTNKKCTST